VSNNKFYKKEKTNKIWWVDNSDKEGVWEFSFDKKKVFNMFADYPNKLTKEQREVFNKENPFWKDFFRDRI